MFTIVDTMDLLRHLKEYPTQAKRLLENALFKTKGNKFPRELILQKLLFDYRAIRYIPFFLSLPDNDQPLGIAFRDNTLPISLTHSEHAEKALESMFSVVTKSKTSYRLLRYYLKHIKEQTALQYLLSLKDDTCPRAFLFIFTFHTQQSHHKSMVYLKKCPDWQKPIILTLLS